jgi:uncharacterized membrane protein
MKSEKFVEPLYQRLKYGLLKKDQELKKKIEEKLLATKNIPMFQRILEMYNFMQNLNLPRVNEKDLPLLAAALPIIYDLTGLVPLDFEETFLAVRYFLLDKISYKKDKFQLTVELLRLRKKELLESVPQDLLKVVDYLASHQGEADEQEFAEVFRLNAKGFYKLVQRLEKQRLAKWTLGFKIKLDVYGKLLAKLRQENEE